MIMVEEVRNLEEILLPKYLGKNGKIVQCDTKRLTEPGENYGSLMLALRLKVKNMEDGQEDDLHVVAKAVPKNEFIQRMFQSPATFKKELGLYKTIVPTLQEFQRGEGMDEVIDLFPEFYGGRLGLGSSYDSFDNDAVILLENLNVRGFFCEDRSKGFDLETAKCILKDLSTLHAVPIALKLKKPDLFQEKILPNLNYVKCFHDLGEDITDYVIDDTIRIAQECGRCVPFLENLKNAMDRAFKYFKNPAPPREPFSTLSHCDFWVNNIMIKREDNKHFATKIIDFQLMEYGSPARDLIFFILNSIQNHVVVENHDRLVKFYHENLIDTLVKYNIDTKPFSLDKFKEEMNMAAKECLITQCIMMIKPMFLEKDATKDLETVSEKDFLEKYEVPQRHKEKLWMIVEEFGKRRWI